ncbi:MAG: sigma-70 family RNA polymerase sigma factor [Chloroflexaceae bacterium]|nr:sigma-70 family RNA polymerase sigma factor [Chloroflexaceae bacterium]
MLTPTSTDNELITRAKASDPNALATIYERYSPGIYRYIYYRVGDAEVAEDLRAEVFLRMLESMDRYEDRGWPISAWLYRIARDRTIDLLRRQQKRPHLPLEAWSDLCDGPEGTVDVQMAREELHRSLAHLTEHQRMVIWLRFIENFSVQEVAQRLGRTEGAVKALQHRALQTLARVLEPPTD